MAFFKRKTSSGSSFGYKTKKRMVGFRTRKNKGRTTGMVVGSMNRKTKKMRGARVW